MPRLSAPDRTHSPPPGRTGRYPKRPGNLRHDDFLGVLSHELRTPVTTIYGGAQMLATRDLPDDRRRALAADVRHEAEHLYRVVEDIVVLLGTERGDLIPVGEPVAIGHLIVTAIERELARDPRLQIRYLGPRDATVDGVDEGFLVHAVRNLLGNAIADSPSGTPIQIVVEVDGDGVVVRFLDGGPPPVARGRRTIDDARTGQTLPGGGVSLLAAGRLIETMHGRSWVRSRAGGGAEFGFALPGAITTGAADA